MGNHATWHRGLGAPVAVAVLVAGVVLACAGDDGQAPSGDGNGGAGTSSPPEALPLLGVVGEAPSRPALAVKVGNAPPGRPPSGLAEADVVYEEMVEGGLTRLLAIYHSRAPETVGPVRSARSTDITILAELGRPLFAWSGANPTFRQAVLAADLVDVGVAAVPGAYERVSGRRAPYNLYADPAALWETGEGRGPPPSLFTYRPEWEPLAGPEVVDVQGWATEAGGELTTSVSWEWDEGSATWLRSQDGSAHVDADGNRVGATNVLVRVTPYHDSGVRDSTGAVVPEAAGVGEGDAWLLSHGQAQPGRWHKPSPGARTTWTDLQGNPLRLRPGRTWVEVLPPGSGHVVG